MKNPLELLSELGVPLDNEYFVIFENEEDVTYDLVFKHQGYEMTQYFLDILSIIYRIGKECKGELRIGVKVEEKKIIEQPKPKIIV